MRKYFPLWVVLSLASSLHAISATWNAPAGPWDDPPSWTPNTIPDAPGDVATFSSSEPTSTGVMNSGSPITIGELALDTQPGVHLTFKFPNPPSGFTFDSNNATISPSINVGSVVSGQSHTINADIMVNASQPSLDVTVNDGSTLTFFDSTVTGNTLHKLGAGTLIFQGTNDLAGFSNDAGNVQFETTPVITGVVDNNATVNGTGTVTTGGFHNSGTVIPGGLNILDPGDVGTIVFQGPVYAQEAASIIQAKAFNSGLSDRLVARGGSVTLRGALILEAANGTFNPGDSITVLDNTGGTGISGTFDNFIQNVPPNVVASIQYEAFQVNILFSAAPVLPPSNFRGVVTKNKFLNKTECILTATWDASPSVIVVLYRIYHNGVVVAEIEATDPLVFTTCLTKCNASGYTIAAVSGDNVESSRVPLEVTL